MAQGRVRNRDKGSQCNTSCTNCHQNGALIFFTASRASLEPLQSVSVLSLSLLFIGPPDWIFFCDESASSVWHWRSADNGFGFERGDIEIEIFVSGWQFNIGRETCRAHFANWSETETGSSSIGLMFDLFYDKRLRPGTYRTKNSAQVR